MLRILALIALLAFRAGAQSAAHRRAGEFDLTLGRHETSGGELDNRTGVMADILLSAPLRVSSTWVLIGGIGGGGAFGGAGDRCLLRQGGGCAPKANFGFANILVGAELPLDKGALRALAGPALYNGADTRSVGVQGRADLILLPFSHLGVGAMVRTTFLPSHGGQNLRASAIGASIIIR
jgi:hypothetical protein